MQRITSAQFFVMLFLCRVFTFFTLTPGSGRALSGASSMAGLALGSAAGVALMIPVWLILRSGPAARRGGAGILEYAFGKSRGAGVAAAALYGLLALFEGVGAVSRFTLFITDAVYPNESAWMFAVLFTAAAMYMVWMGLEAAARFSGVVLIAFLISAGLIILALLPEFHLTNVASPFLDGSGPIVREALSTLGEQSELTMVILFIPYLRGDGKKIRKGFLLWAGSLVLALEALLFLALTTVGDYAVTQTYPLYAVAKMARLFQFQRLDALHMVVWTLVALIKASVFLYIARQCFYCVLSKKVQKGILPVLGIIVMIAALLLTSYYRAYEAFYTIALSGAALYLGVLAVPLVLAAIPRAKGAKGGESR